MIFPLGNQMTVCLTEPTQKQGDMKTHLIIKMEKQTFLLLIEKPWGAVFTDKFAFKSNFCMFLLII